MQNKSSLVKLKRWHSNIKKKRERKLCFWETLYIWVCSRYAFLFYVSHLTFLIHSCSLSSSPHFSSMILLMFSLSLWNNKVQMGDPLLPGFPALRAVTWRRGAVNCCKRKRGKSNKNELTACVLTWPKWKKKHSWHKENPLSF